MIKNNADYKIIVVKYKIDRIKWNKDQNKWLRLNRVKVFFFAKKTFDLDEIILKVDLKNNNL